MDILGTLLRVPRVSWFALVITDRYTKLTGAVAKSRTTALPIASLFLDNMDISYGIPDYVLKDNGIQFISMFFESLCAFLDTEHFTTTAYHMQTSREAEGFERRGWHGCCTVNLNIRGAVTYTCSH